MKVPEQFVMCRMVSHAWERFTDPDFFPSFGRGLSLECSRCGTIRRDVISGGGAVLARWYLYPEGYTMPKGHGVTRADVRVQFIEKLDEVRT